MKELANADSMSLGRQELNQEWLEKAQYALNPSNLRSWTAGIRFSQVPDMIASHLKSALLNSYLNSIAQHLEEMDKKSLHKAHVIYCTDDCGNIRDLNLSPDVSERVDSHLRRLVVDRLDQGNVWEDAVRWYWNHSVIWTMEAMSQEFDMRTMSCMSERTWSKVYSKTLCYANPERFNSLFNIYAKNFAHLYMQSLQKEYPDSSRYNLVFYEEFLGLNAPAAGGQGILRPKMLKEKASYLTTFSMAMYHQLRKAVAAQEFTTHDDGSCLSASLETPSGSSSGRVILKREHNFCIEPSEKIMKEVNDETVDLMDSICHLWLKRFTPLQERITIHADDILALRGLRKQKNGQGQRGGYKSEWRERISAHMDLLDRLWISPSPNGESSFGLEEKAFIISKSHDLQREGNKGDYIWEVRPGNPLVQDLQKGKRQTAILSKRVLEMDPYRHAYEKRAARYFSWLWRSRQSRGDYLEPIGITTLLDAIHLQYQKSRSAKTIERFEKMMDTLRDKEVIAGWQYDRIYRNGRDWLELKLVIEPPQAIIDQYAKIKSPTKPGRPPKSERTSLCSLGEQLKKERLRKKLTQMQAAEDIGIAQTTISKLESGRRVPDFKTARKIQQWLKITASS
ncbi:transcriptional regulator, XRE family [Desulfitobacterium hafniense DCB-2]|uniref:Transcriptional regulator, XRE family n=1 Tax=Desulfitobacterium hafniense (strain DSM 10664 / DCB-2) TaxID=272564 RepID=B8FWV3_DESHD|nr:helix-turn-helix transcriptional regulator [Desulfitobacterium hafniense]ACL18839.1 transcriptional regulator, XRE family [Desulfitobacterium hafniense DCB-2]